MPIFSVDGASIMRMVCDDLLEHFNRILTDYFGSLSMLDRMKLDDDIKEILENIHGNLTREEQKELNKSSKGRGKNSKRTKIDDVEKGKVEKIEDYIIKARLITNRFKNFLFVVDKISNINDIFNYKDEFKTQTGIDVENFKVLLDKGFILEEKM